jgi:hypothetical protein
MFISKPADEDRSKAAPRSGHGAASVIPHINQESPRPRDDEPQDEPSAGSERTTPSSPLLKDRGTSS